MQNYSSYTDDELICLVKEGNLKAFAEIHKRYYGLLYRHAFKRLPDSEEVKDLLQELFTYMWHNRESLSLTTSLSAYLFTSARNRILNVFKHDKVKNNYLNSLQKFVEHGEPQADDQLRIKELIAIVEAGVAQMPLQMRIIFEMSRNGHLSHQEIAEKLNISPLTVRKQVQNSLRILRVKLGPHFFLLFL
ncbi:RNA polymerase sigma-70 factor (ECF subfamily) [Mucilaginibacter frigoritolerans]|uniref:RNA polymerase sigma-70 factor (ECF subfamily) n=1 Tax=Mucilaginibacter frigoritolerans TaxID=652788 RepID=A0A562TKC0_9SPHI|nr:RNA polymerase sigma-70 factor [Mucilaginibacter frigoritolerans]TWI93922.1 RNA polymerase sigma-70 factor (ECF subfamily) [Mucilaginibacter frigoritolerans]